MTKDTSSSFSFKKIQNVLHVPSISRENFVIIGGFKIWLCEIVSLFCNSLY